jgi:hypothetical protein
MEEALLADGNAVPAGSAELERSPIRLGSPPDELAVAAAGASPDPATAHEAVIAPESGEPPTLT